MGVVKLIASNLPSSRRRHVFIFPERRESSGTGKSWAYVFFDDNRIVYLIDLNEALHPKSMNVKALVLPSPPLEMFHLTSYHCVLLEDGSIYKITETAVSEAENFTKVKGCSQEKQAWPKAFFILERDKLFQNKNCKSVCSFGELACLLFANGLNWFMNIYKIDVSASKEDALMLVHTIELPQMMTEFTSIQPPKPCMTSFLFGDGEGENELNSRLCPSIFGSKLQLHCEGVVLVSTQVGDVFFIPVVNDSLKDISAFPLFCFNEPIIKIQKVLVKTAFDALRIEVGILFVGVSGKVAVLSRSSNEMQETGPNITEFHLPGPIYIWSGFGGIACHSDGSSLWKTIFKIKNCQDDGFGIISRSTNEHMRPCGIHLFNNREQGLNILLHTANGDLIFINNYRESMSVCPAFGSTLKHVHLKELLNAIHECSKELSRIYRHQGALKGVLNELSCAAHLILNDKVRNKLIVVVNPVWTSAECIKIIITVELSNEGDFNIVGNHWHFVVTIKTGAGRYLSKSVPLNGFEAGRKVDATVMVKVGDIVTDNELPFAVTSGLQLFLDAHAENTSANSFNNGYQSPVSFYIKLSDSSVNQLSFFSKSFDAQSMYCEPSISNALWEIARTRLAMTFHDLGCRFQVSNKPLDSSIFNFVTVKRGFVKKLSKREGVSVDTVLTTLLKCIVSDSKIELSNDVTDIELYVFGQKVKFSVRDNGINVQIKIIVWCPSLLHMLRFAILKKLKLINNEDSDVARPRPNQLDGFAIMPTVLNSCLNLTTRLLPRSSQKQETQIGLVSHIYAEMRELVSSELPFL